ncbi:Response regulator receiver domain-containing protein [Halovenus aranensis]|uniref:Response regulator receiver domain-containing protein n=1 Tax=Halovenus aranensis TaxID=890420 RepID=A0A1G8UU83_9EURY|nr:HalX domain-containing protein [Halovenus aranensis]SDJ56500.1 Response regulator receiver domain-containing protein [Halovenus aranensis]
MSSSEPATVLVVDDEPDVADAYAAQLQGEYIVSTAYGGQEALDKMDDAVDIVLLDRRMPGISGDEVLEKIRERDLHVRVAMVTAVDPDFDIIEMPFDDYVIKPVSRDDLFETIERLLTCSEYEERLRRYYALTAKHATLVANKPESELAESEAFDDLEAKMDSIQDDLDETISTFDDEDFEAAFRDLNDESLLDPPEE